MKSRIFVAIAIAACSLTVHAQWNYDAKGVESLTDSYKEIGKKGTPIKTNTEGNPLDGDNDNSAVQSIGFDFKFNGKTFNQFVLNTNGFIKLGNVAPSSKSIYYAGAMLSNGSVITAKDSNLIYAFNRNLKASDKGAEFKMMTKGSDGKRVCIIEFKNLADNVTPSQYSNMAFQIKLYEGTNVIEFVYDEWTPSENPATLSIAAVGIKGDNTERSINIAKGSVVPWNDDMNKPSMPYAFVNGNYLAKGPNFGNKNSALPEAGHTYRFTPIK